MRWSCAFDVPDDAGSEQFAEYPEHTESVGLAQLDAEPVVALSANDSFDPSASFQSTHPTFPDSDPFS